MVHFEFGQDRLAHPHPLKAFELAQRSVESPLEARFVAEQAIQCRGLGNGTAHSFDLLMLPQSSNLPVDCREDALLAFFGSCKTLADGRPDHPASVISLCPNCHRRAHHSKTQEDGSAR